MALWDNLFGQRRRTAAPTPMSGLGYPSAIYPTRQRINRDALVGPPSVLNVIPQNGQQLIQPGETFDFSLRGDFHIFEVSIDAPAGVTFDYSHDGAVLVSSHDGAGFIGPLRVGDFAAGRYMKANTIRITGDNTTTGSLDVRCWVVAS